jgi:hypothetical protein
MTRIAHDRRHRSMPLKGALPLLLALGITTPGCGLNGGKYLDVTCTPPTTMWYCMATLVPRNCGCKVNPPLQQFTWAGCGVNAAGAANDTEIKLEEFFGPTMLLNQYTIAVPASTCMNTEFGGCGTGKTVMCPPPPKLQSLAPKVKLSFKVPKPPHPPTPQDTCTASPDDNACTTCVKGSCCSDYQNCMNDVGCLCWVTCKAAGYTDTTCEQSGYCGPLDAVSMSAASCLDANCGAECGTMITGTGGSSGSCDCGTGGSTGTGGDTGTTTACTPGTFGPGESCFSDGDCTSCSCNTQTMTCN